MLEEYCVMTTSTLGVEEGDVGRVLEGDERQGKSGCRGNTEEYGE